MHNDEYRGMREALGYTAEEMAAHHNVALKTQQRWENGHRPIPEGVVREMRRLALEFRMYAHTETAPLPTDKPARWCRAVMFQRTWI